MSPVRFPSAVAQLAAGMQLDTTKHDSFSTVLIGVVLSLQILSAAVVASRLFTRIKIVRNVGADDTLIVVATALAITHTAIVVVCARVGAGRHIWDVTPADARRVLQTSWLSSIFYGVVLMFIKLSISVFYLRLFPFTAWRRFIISLIVVVCIFSIGSTFAVIFQCIPVSALWTGSAVIDPLHPPHCINFPAYYFSNAAFGMVTDFILILIPIPMLWGVKLPRRQKLGLIGVFAVGSIPCVASVVRIASITHVAQSPDFTHDLGTALLWSCIELHLSAMCACAPSLKPLLRRYAPALLGSSLETSNAYSSNVANGASKRQTGGTFPLKSIQGTGGTVNVHASHSIYKDPIDTGLNNDSDENVFQFQIVKTTEVVVSDKNGVRSVHPFSNDASSQLEEK